ncbi:MAG TPA: flagellar hook capping FlgD N-terminal domain-containing protein [Steroidobacteraceae bacterium]|jgi:flagellar basal-body rod modification protein FlgD
MSSSTDQIAAYAAQTQAALAAAQTKKSASNLGIDDFLTLMTTQLKNQDPMKPLDGTEFVSQLAQFGQVSGIQQMQSSMDSLSTSLRSNQALSGTALVGRDVLADADDFQYTQGVPVSGQIDVPDAGITGLQIRITDSSGQVVRQIQSVPTIGTNTFSWDGLNDDGSAAGSGKYDIEAIATAGDANGSLPIEMAGRVDSVTLDSTGTGLTLNTTALGPVAMADVRRVK